MNPHTSDWAEHRAASHHAPDPEPLDPSDALGHDDSPNPTPPHVCGQDPDPWCEVCGAAVRAWMRGACGRGPCCLTDGHEGHCTTGEWDGAL